MCRPGTGPAFVNDIASPVLHRAPPDGGQPRRIPLTGDITCRDGFNANGVTPPPAPPTPDMEYTAVAVTRP